ncbi:hypothetical protein EOW65_15150 [Sinirhodobacter ferrireducens]|uniref:Uncharacterized protein n=1 Tax=Paenirhodobacter ferrireducens TaxID=1215032 RepID=A0A443L9R6_9RHOB|nr:hypothetical protein [Sinirhodobacter ferrireducens]RWR45879.1 hypothetical protein EOW65_15150 [Sinirhodobacter ferrireducens]
MASAKSNVLSAETQGISRRKMIAAALTAPALAVSSGPAIADMSREARIQHHAEALLALIRGAFPEEATSMSVTVNSNWGPVEGLNNRMGVDARVLSAVWKDDPRMKNGGVWIENSLGHWAPGVGRY